jgi:TonB family protein
VAGPGAPGGRFQAVQPKRPSEVAAVLPESVRTYDLSGWAGEVLNRIQRYWTLGVDASADWTGMVGVEVQVLKAGDVIRIEISAPSSVDALDRSAQKALELSAPFPALPADFPESSLEITFVFRYGR